MYPRMIFALECRFGSPGGRGDSRDSRVLIDLVSNLNYSGNALKLGLPEMQVSLLFRVKLAAGDSGLTITMVAAFWQA